jgi:hypothetical protein
MPVLSAYLGHVSPAGTYWYLTAVPELMELAAARLHVLTLPAPQRRRYLFASRTGFRPSAIASYLIERARAVNTHEEAPI